MHIEFLMLFAGLTIFFWCQNEEETRKKLPLPMAILQAIMLCVAIAGLLIIIG